MGPATPALNHRMEQEIAIGSDGTSGLQGGKAGSKSMFRCTRTCWAVLAISVLLAVALAIGLAVGLPMIRRSTGAHSVPIRRTLVAVAAVVTR